MEEDCCARKVFSLREIMNHFNLTKIALALSNLRSWEESLGQRREKDGGGAELIELDFVQCGLLITEGLQACSAAQFFTALQRIHEVARFRNFDPAKKDLSTAISDVRRIQDAIWEELDKRRFVSVSPEKVAYLEPPPSHGFGPIRPDHIPVFGVYVEKAFRSARDDIREAGNCLALECNTAAVFHLMRVAEHGLRALARDRRVKIPKNKPIELATWEDIIEQLESAEDAIKDYPKTLARQAQFDFYHGAMMEFRAFKNVFRNPIMHSRARFNDHEAIAICSRVCQFMQILSGHISETTRTPMIWKTIPEKGDA
jgi:hypothetical protein